MLPGVLYAQEITQTIRGKVRDKDTQAPLIGVNIIVKDADQALGSTSDLDGNFEIEEVPLGRRDILVSYVGYKDQYLSSQEISSGKELVLDIQLEESVEQLDELVIQGKADRTQSLNELASVSARTFGVGEAARYAGSRNDISRMATNYAGVANADDSRNDIIIRGNSPVGLLWRFEGLDIPSPNHFSDIGNNGGPVSMLNYNVIANSDFMTSAFPSEYGNAVSGVFDINMRQGNHKSREYMLQVGALGTEVMLEGPFSNNGEASYLVNYRFSTTSVLSVMGIDFGYDGDADYQDLAFKFNFPTKKLGTFTFFGMGGMSDYKLLYEDQDEESFDVSMTENSNNTWSTDMFAVGLSNTFNIDSRTYGKVIVGASGQYVDGKVDSVVLSNFTSVPYFQNQSTSYNYSFHGFVNHKFSARHIVKLGVQLDNKDYDMDIRQYEYGLGQMMPLRQSVGNNWLLQSYLHWKYNISDQLILNSGLRYQRFYLNDSESFEPRAGLAWHFAPAQSFNVGYGLHGQMQILPVYFLTTPTPDALIKTNEGLGFNKSHHIVLGYSNRLGENLSLKLEAYYQHLFDIPIHMQHNPSSYSVLNEGYGYTLGDEDSLVNEGKGQNYGIELTLERFLDNGYYFLFTTSLFESKYLPSDGIWRNTAFNGNYIVNFLTGKEFPFGKNNKFICDIKLTTAGGRRYTPIDETKSRDAGEAIFHDEYAFSQQQDPYFRTDLKLTYRKERPKTSHEFFINIDNLFNTQNVFVQVYSPKTNQIENVYQLGMFPTFQYKLTF